MASLKQQRIPLLLQSLSPSCCVPPCNRHSHDVKVSLQVREAYCQFVKL